MSAGSPADVQKASGCERGLVLNWFAALDVRCFLEWLPVLFHSLLQ